MAKPRAISIWFFIGVLLVIYGFLIIGAGMMAMFVPPERPTVMAELHIELWWGSLLLLIGGFYTIRFAPR